MRPRECDPAGCIPCIQSAAFLSIPVIDTGLYLTYSSQWTTSKAGQGDWQARSLGVSGWSTNLVRRYDAKTHVILSGDGSWRIANFLALLSGERAVPSYAGSLAYVFDAAGRHVRTAVWNGFGESARPDGVPLAGSVSRKFTWELLMAPSSVLLSGATTRKLREAVRKERVWQFLRKRLSSLLWF